VKKLIEDNMKKILEIISKEALTEKKKGNKDKSRKFPSAKLFREINNRVSEESMSKMNRKQKSSKYYENFKFFENGIFPKWTRIERTVKKIRIRFTRMERRSI
jgi:hypothetical protein